MFAMMAVGGFVTRPQVNKVGAYDIVGLLLVSFGVFIHNYAREKTQQVCIIDPDSNNDKANESSVQESN